MTVSTGRFTGNAVQNISENLFSWKFIISAAAVAVAAFDGKLLDRPLAVCDALSSSVDILFVGTLGVLRLLLVFPS